MLQNNQLINQNKITTPPAICNFDQFMNNLAENNISDMLLWLAAIRPSLSALEEMSEDHKFKTKKAIEFYYHTDDILTISQQYNLVPQAKELIKKL